MKKIIMILLLLTLTACDNQTFIDEKYKGEKIVSCINIYDGESDTAIYSKSTNHTDITAVDDYITSYKSVDTYEFLTERSKKELASYNLRNADEIFRFLKRYNSDTLDDFEFSYTYKDDIMIITHTKIIPPRKEGFFGLIVPESNSLSEFLDDDFLHAIYNCEIK